MPATLYILFFIGIIVHAIENVKTPISQSERRLLSMSREIEISIKRDDYQQDFLEISNDITNEQLYQIVQQQILNNNTNKLLFAGSTIIPNSQEIGDNVIPIGRQSEIEFKIVDQLTPLLHSVDEVPGRYPPHSILDYYNRSMKAFTGDSYLEFMTMFFNSTIYTDSGCFTMEFIDNGFWIEITSIGFLGRGILRMNLEPLNLLNAARTNQKDKRNRNIAYFMHKYYSSAPPNQSEDHAVIVHGEYFQIESISDDVLDTSPSQMARPIYAIHTDIYIYLSVHIV